jgi:predicted MFS family arabinose efflux permease
MSAGAAQTPAGSLRWALLSGNFAIGFGVMVVAGSLNDLVRSLQVSVPAGGQLITVASAVMAMAAPLLAWWLGAIDRRVLLTLSLLWYAVGHAASALAPDYATLTPLRAACVLGAVVFSPQAAAAIGWLTPPERRGQAITFIFLGWSVASVLGMPLASLVSETWGWRSAFGLVATVSLLAAVWVWRVTPAGVKPAVSGLAAWRQVGAQPVLLAVVLVTALSGSGQFAIFSYFAPYMSQVLGATAQQIALTFFVFGAFGVLGTVLVSRHIDRVGAAPMVTALLGLMALGFVLWPWAGSVLALNLVLVPWALGCFSSNSAQQARLSMAAPSLAGVLIALNTSAIYIGQALGAAGGGALIAANTAAGRPAYAGLWCLALAWMVLALGVSAWAARRTKARA